MKRLCALVLAIVGLLGLMTSVSAEAGPASISAREIDGAKLAGGERLWVHVYHVKGQKLAASASCTDTNTQTLYRLFAKAKKTGLAFKLTAGSVPSYLGTSAVANTVGAAFTRWNAVKSSYFTFSSSGGKSQPSDDGTNSVGFGRFIGPGAGSALAATWTWTNSSNRVKAADIFFNTKFTFGIYTTCNARSTYEVGNIITHEIGHTIALDHVQDSQAMATMYPSAPAGEVKKRSLTTGDKKGFLAAVA